MSLIAVREQEEAVYLAQVSGDALNELQRRAGFPAGTLNCARLCW